MPPIVSRFEVDRLPDEVFAYVTDPSRFAEWQDDVVRVRPGGRSTARRGNEVHHHPADRARRVDDDAGDHGAQSSQELGLSRCRRTVPAKRGHHRRAARRRHTIAGHDRDGVAAAIPPGPAGRLGGARRRYPALTGATGAPPGG
jgi:hypothetical protein